MGFKVSRFRLRFLLQEFDLPVGEVVLGRSPECHVTIEDPLISRQHAKILVTQNSCTFVDLGSRNGSRINGRYVTAPTALQDSDRLRLGAQELVFFEMGTSVARRDKRARCSSATSVRRRFPRARACVLTAALRRQRFPKTTRPCRAWCSSHVAPGCCS